MSNSDELDHIEQQIRHALDAGDSDEALRLGAILDEADQRKAERIAATSLGAAALWYAEQGIRVFPLQPRGKLPATRDGFYAATTDANQIRRWWTSIPEANIGAPTGHIFDVIDIDGVQGILSLGDKLAALRDRAIGIVCTPRPGGLHYYLSANPSRRNRAARSPGVDTRATGGYVLLPPSVTDEHGAGRRYTWLRPLNPEQEAK